MNIALSDLTLVVDGQTVDINVAGNTLTKDTEPVKDEEGNEIGSKYTLVVKNLQKNQENERKDKKEDVRTFVFTQSDVDDLDFKVQLELPVGTYQFKAWTDFVDANSKDDKYYDTSEFSEIVLANKDNHVGSNDYRFMQYYCNEE